MIETGQVHHLLRLVLIVLQVCKITTVIYAQLRNNRIKIKNNVRPLKRGGL